MDEHSILLLLTVFLLLMNGVFVATEFAMVNVRISRIKELMENGSSAAKYTYDALMHLDAYLSAAQLGITLASLGLGWIGEPVVATHLIAPILQAVHLHSPSLTTLLSFAIAFVLIAFAQIVFGELAPKSLAVQRAEQIALLVAVPMRVFYWFVKPCIFVLTSAAIAVLRPLHITPVSGTDLVHSEEELRMIITASGSEHGGTLRDSQAELLDKVFNFGHRLARQIMIHRTELQMLDIADTLEENVQTAHTLGHTRFPVYEGDIDTVIGFIHTKDLFALYQRDPASDMRTILREALIVPETIRIDLLLRQLQKKRQPLAILVDEYGGTAGLITVADLLEELVGDLPDEFQLTEEEWVTSLGDQQWSVDGRLPLDDLAEAVDRDISCEDSCDTVGGYAYWAFGRIPALHDSITRDGITVRVLAMDGRRVSRVEISVDPAENEKAENTTTERGKR